MAAGHKNIQCTLIKTRSWQWLELSPKKWQIWTGHWDLSGSLQILHSIWSPSDLLSLNTQTTLAIDLYNLPHATDHWISHSNIHTSPGKWQNMYFRWTEATCWVVLTHQQDDNVGCPRVNLSWYCQEWAQQQWASLDCTDTCQLPCALYCCHIDTPISNTTAWKMLRWRFLGNLWL